MPTKLFCYIALFVLTPSLTQLIPPNITNGLCTLIEHPPVCPDTYDPVCVLVPKVCDLIPCPYIRDARNPCQGCSLPEVEAFTAGRCQYACQPDNLLPAWVHPDTNLTVCGYSQQNCLDSICKQEFDTVNLACVDPDILYFTLGSCSDDEEFGIMEEMESTELGLEEFLNQEECEGFFCV